jgi:hypothetical protein
MARDLTGSNADSGCSTNAEGTFRAQPHPPSQYVPALIRRLTWQRLEACDLEQYCAWLMGGLEENTNRENANDKGDGNSRIVELECTNRTHLLMDFEQPRTWSIKKNQRMLFNFPFHDLLKHL